MLPKYCVALASNEAKQTFAQRLFARPILFSKDETLKNVQPDLSILIVFEFFTASTYGTQSVFFCFVRKEISNVLTRDCLR